MNKKILKKMTITKQHNGIHANLTYPYNNYKKKKKYIASTSD